MARPNAFTLLAAFVCALVLAGLPPQRAQAALDPYTVTTTRDLLGAQCGADAQYPNECSLRQAVTKARTDAPSSGAGITVKFAIQFTEQSGPNQGAPMPGYDGATRTWTVTLTNGPLPIIDKVVNIDGATQATTAGFDNLGPLVFVDGKNVTTRGGFTFQNVTGATISRIGVINFLGSSSPGDFAGVGIELLNSSSIKIIGCSVGVNQAGTAAAPNDAAGILIQLGGDNIIGGNNSLNSEFNVVSGNATDGILIRNSNGNKIIGNRIGTDRFGSTAIPNGDDGVDLSLKSIRTQVGTPPTQPLNDATLRNTIAGNGGFGVSINEASGNQVNGNWIGNNYASSTVLANGAGGVQIFSSVSEPATNNVIGGDTPDARNIIAGNNGPGVAITGPLSSDNTVRNNYIGVGLQPVVAFGNTVGVEITGGGDRNTVGSAIFANQGNVISGNRNDAIRISGTSDEISVGTVVKANVIGLFPTTGQPKGNAGIGVLVGGYTTSTAIGGAGTAEKNIISANAGTGVVVSTNSLTTTVAGNVISLSGIGAPPKDGILISGAKATIIGGSSAAAGNVITGNTGNGIRIASTGTTTTTIRYNTIGGTDEGLSNTLNGVLVEGASGPIDIRNGKIYGNGQNGVLVSGNTQHVGVLNTSFTANGQKGIALTPATAGSPGSANNANHDIDPPFNIRVNQAKRITGRVLSEKSGSIFTPASCDTCTVQIFATDPLALDGEGRDQIVATDVKPDKSGYFTATLPFIPNQLALTATDKTGNTSEFATFTTNYSVDISPDRAASAAPSTVVTYTHQIQNNGTIDFADLGLTAVSSKGWKTTVAPSGAISLAPGETKPVTVTVTLPQGTDPSVAAGSPPDLTTVTLKSTAVPTATDSVVDTTTILGRFVFQITPPSRTGSGVPGSTVPYAHTIKNVGNISGTVTVDAASFLTNNSPAIDYTTTVTPTRFVLLPGQSVDTTARVTIPAGAETSAPPVRTQIRLNAASSGGNQTAYITDTTTVALQQQATLVFDQEGDAAAGEKISFQHTLTNQSNGPATFKLIGSSSLGSTIKFSSNTPGVTIGSDGSVTLNTSAGGNILNFFAEITVSNRARRGQVDLVTISVSDKNGVIIGGASVQDRINVVANALTRVYAPIVSK